MMENKLIALLGKLLPQRAIRSFGKHISAGIET